MNLAFASALDQVSTSVYVEGLFSDLFTIDSSLVLLISH